MNDDRGDLNKDQVQQLLRPVNPSRVVTGAHVKPHLSQQDVVAHLIRVFGFGHYDVEVMESRLLFEEPTTNSGGKPAWNVGYLARVRLTIRDDRQRLVASYDGGSTGESDGQPSRADSHDLAFKSALSTATKRAAIHLGDQFGLSLYNKGQMEPLVRGTMVGVPRADDGDMQDGVTQQEEDGGAVADRQDAAAEESQEAPEAEPAPRRRAATGRQGTKRKSAPTDAPEPVAEEPAAPAEAATEPDPQPDPAVVAQQAAEAEERREAEERARIAAEQEAAQRARDKREAEVAANQQRLRDVAAQQAAARAEAEPVTYTDPATGQTFATSEEMDAAIKARRAETQTHDSLASWDSSDPALASAYEVARDEEMSQDQPNYERLVQAARNQVELKDMYQLATDRQHMNTALRALVVSRKAELPET